jgi:phosphoglycerate kinase
MARFRTLDDHAVAGKRVLVRADLNLPVQGGRVTDSTRIDRLLPTLRELIDKKARVVVMSHFGRPRGKPADDMSLRPMAAALSAALGGTPVAFAPDCIGPDAAAVVDGLQPGSVALLENLRFHSGEESNEEGFARALASLGDLYVDDAFSCAHRAHASVDALARLLPAAAGRGMEAELAALERALGTPERPVAAIVGGAKVSTKLDLLGNLVNRVNVLAIGGGMANTFLHARGVSVGRSLCEPDLAATALDIVDRADRCGCTIVLPEDVVVAERLAADVPARTVAVGSVPEDMMILDVGPNSADALAEKLGDCRTLVWNGPLGAFETPPFDAATVTVARAAAALTEQDRLLSVAGGGDTVAALSHAGVADKFSYLSAAGGAFLEWLEGKTLPGVAVLSA